MKTIPLISNYKTLLVGSKSSYWFTLSLFWGSYFFDFQIAGYLRLGCLILGLYWLGVEIKHLFLKITASAQAAEQEGENHGQLKKTEVYSD